METGIEIITAERKRQFEVEGYSVMQDFYRNSKGELANAAAVYAIDPMGGDASYITGSLWPWKHVNANFSCLDNTEECPEERIKDLAKAGALIAAEIDRIQFMIKMKA